MSLKEWGKRLLRGTVFYPDHMGSYIREKYFWREVGKLPVGSFNRVLDAGCGPGSYAQQFAQRYPSVEVTACDIRDRYESEGAPENLRFELLDLKALDKPECFDLIWSIDVLEHIPGNRKVIENFRKALRSGGYLLVHIPYGVGRRHFFPRPWFASVYKWAEREHIGEQYSLEELCEVLRQEGLQIMHAQWTFGFWGQLPWEIDRLTDKLLPLKVLLAPVLKLLALFALRRRHNNPVWSNVLVVARKP